MNKREEWEYTDNLFLPAEDGSLIDFLNEHGKEGWELVYLEKIDKLMTKCIFKRKKL